MDRMTDGSSNGTMTDNAMILKKLSEILRRYVEPDPEKKRKFWQKMNKFLYPNDIYFE